MAAKFSSEVEVRRHLVIIGFNYGRLMSEAIEKQHSTHLFYLWYHLKTKITGKELMGQSFRQSWLAAHFYFKPELAVWITNFSERP